MNWKRGDIVKIGRTGEHCNGSWVGFVSELMSISPRGSRQNLTMLYGNYANKVYSEMNFWDHKILVKPTDEDIRVYTEVLPELKKQFKEVREVEVLGYINQISSSYCEVEVGSTVEVFPYLNVFDGGIYARHCDSYTDIKIWDNTRGLLLPKTKKYLLIA